MAMNIKTYLARPGSPSLSELSALCGVTNARISQLREAKKLPPDLALRLEDVTNGAIDASKFSLVVAKARGK